MKVISERAAFERINRKLRRLNIGLKIRTDGSAYYLAVSVDLTKLAQEFGVLSPDEVIG